MAHALRAAAVGHQALLLEVPFGQRLTLADRQIEVGLCSLAVPVLSRHGQVVAALNVGVPAATVSAAALKEKALAPLRRAAMDLSLQL